MLHQEMDCITATQESGMVHCKNSSVNVNPKQIQSIGLKYSWIRKLSNFSALKHWIDPQTLDFGWIGPALFL